jgi:hypothetical protein
VLLSYFGFLCDKRLASTCAKSVTCSHNAIKTASPSAIMTTAMMTQVSAHSFDLFRYNSIPILVLSKTEPGENEGKDGEYPADDGSDDG